MEDKVESDERKDETPHFIIKSEGREIENKEDILKEYQRYYESLLQKKGHQKIYRGIQNKRKTQNFKKLQMINLEWKEKKVTQLEVKKTTLKMKNNNSGDDQDGKQNG